MSTALPTPSPADRRGFSLLEVLVAMVILTVIASSAVGFFRSQNQSMIKGAERLDIVQNGRFGVSQVERVIRTMGSGVTGLQPMLVYGGDSVVAINTDYVENDSTDFRWATNLNPYLPDAATLAWDFADRTAVPTTSYLYPPVTFRQANGTKSPAETVIFYLEPDPSTARTDDLVLMMRINSQAPDLVTRNLLPYPGRPFFEYSLARRLGSGADTMFFASGTLKPLIRRIPDATFSGADSANAIRPDSVRAIRINFKVTNGLTGTDDRTITL
ncbi:MAG: prepilin-type N-terminal cleavage/methylation domain-containing protein [Gemmatimonadota bacterium]|mgnify:FL=1